MAKKTISPGQLRVRAAFKAGVAFLAPLNGLVKNGFSELAKRKNSLAGGLALGYLLKVAIRQEEEGPVVDPALVRLSEGSLPDIYGISINRYADYIELTHEVRCSRFLDSDDRLILCAYQVEKGYAYVNERIWQRREGRVKVPIPEGFRADGFHLYLLLSDRKSTKYSRSKYLGYSTI